MIMRRFRRICAAVGSKLTLSKHPWTKTYVVIDRRCAFVSCSATISNPEKARLLTSQTARAILTASASMPEISSASQYALPLYPLFQQFNS